MMPCVFCLYTLLKVVGYYDLSVQSMSVMGFQKKVWMGVGVWGELYPWFFLVFGIVLTLQNPLAHPSALNRCNKAAEQLFPLE